MDFSSYSSLQFARRGRVLEITMNRPDKLNAIDERMHAELARVFVEASGDLDSDVVVLGGGGRAFSAGGDIDWMQKMIDEPGASNHRPRGQADRVLAARLREAGGSGHATWAPSLFCDCAAARPPDRRPALSVGFVAER